MCHDRAVVGDQVDLVVNVFERTYRRVLAPGWFPRLTDDNGYGFARRVVLVNNTEDPVDAARLANDLIARKEIDEWHFVADRIGSALEMVGLRPRDLHPLPHYSDCALTALCLDGAEFVVYWDADVHLVTPCDWVTPSLDLLHTEPQVVVANPCWDGDEARSAAFSVKGDFALGYGFSDWAWLARRSTFREQNWSAPAAPASYRYPLSHITPVFEQRVDTWMRYGRFHRATYLPATAAHDGPVGTMYPATTPRQRARRRVQSLALRSGRRWMPNHPAWSPYPKRP